MSRYRYRWTAKEKTDTAGPCKSVMRYVRMKTGLIRAMQVKRALKVLCCAAKLHPVSTHFVTLYF